ncbi:FG-GAP repeat domain-containing protein [Paenibacillus contaminans]|nr:VCBS repeat-containing protein [Paenibacillus contaminans]
MEHKGFEQLRKGTFGGGGGNLFVDASGIMRRIMDNDLRGNGCFDLVLPNSHGYMERAPTYVYTAAGEGWAKAQLPHDSGWKPIAADVDGDGYLDLIVLNGENGVTSELQSYIYWGGPQGLTGERTAFDTIGAYDAAVCDISGSGLKSVIFATSWQDHHNPGIPMYQKVYEQTAPREFADRTEQYKLAGTATVSLICEDLNGDGYPELVLANYREGYHYDVESTIYWGGVGGFHTTDPTRLPTRYAVQVQAADLNGDGWKEIIFTGGNTITIYWNRAGRFAANDCKVLEIPGLQGQFIQGMLTTDIADIDCDGIPELVIGTIDGVEIRKTDRLEEIWQKLPCYGCSWVKTADIRNTGRLDIITSHYCTTQTYDTQSLVFWNREAGFSAEHVTAFDTHGPMGCLAADLDNDGIKEIVFCNTMSGPSQYDPEFPVFVYYGTDDYQYKTENRKHYPVNAMCHTYAAADVDNDGFTELLVTTMNGIRIFKGTADGPDPGQYVDLLHPSAENGEQGRLVGGVIVSDYNCDGWLDVMMVPWVLEHTEEDLNDSVYIFFGGPEGYCADRRQLLPAFTKMSQAVLLADINNDGYADFLYGDGEGHIGVYYGGLQGFELERTGRITLKEYNGAPIMGIAAADVDQDGWLELFVTTAGHYTRKASHVYVLKDGRQGYPEAASTRFETGGTTGFAALADMYGSGNLDLLLPFYSTTETRELPARIFRGDGQGNFDWEHPQCMDCLSSIAFTPVDLNGNGYPDLFICCHRNDLGHMVNSKLIMNGPDGLDFDHVQEIAGYGPHNFTAVQQGNSYDRSDKEYYKSPVFACEQPTRISWAGETPYRTAITFRVRFGGSEEETENAAWSAVIAVSGTTISAPTGSGFMQYEACFCAPGFVNSPKLKAVIIE